MKAHYYFSYALMIVFVIILIIDAFLYFVYGIKPLPKYFGVLCIFVIMNKIISGFFFHLDNLNKENVKHKESA
jgi:uncharacterized membrane protein